MSTESDSGVGMVKIAIAWIGTLLGGVTLNGALSTVVLLLTIVFTFYQIVRIRRQLERDDERESEYP